MLFARSIALPYQIDDSLRGGWSQIGKERIGRAAVAIGGFIIMIGVILLGTFVLAFFGVFDTSLFLNEEGRVILVWALLILGATDLISGIILYLR